MKTRQYDFDEETKELASRLDFVEDIDQKSRQMLIAELDRMAKQIEEFAPNTAYRIRRIYIPILEEGKVPNTREFPNLIKKTELNIDDLVKELNILCQVFSETEKR
ncbi:MAG: hypothetical protein HOC78_03130 [Candidatus Komeilibacteria bacterium]|nr:hypothetical protein [Candidatus Komeilibacteria bacterium]